MKPVTHFKKAKIFLNIFLTLGAIFALAINTHAQNLYVSANIGAIYEYTPDGTQSTYASRLSQPRGLAFDNLGNFFAAETILSGHTLTIGKALKFNVRNKATTLGSAADFFFEGLAIDIAGNVYVMAQSAPTFTPGTIYKFAPDGTRTVFGTIPGGGFGLAFDSAYNLYAADSDDQTIYEFAPDGTRTVFVGPSAFTDDTVPVGLAFDSTTGNLFVSTEGDAPNDTILEFTPNGMESTFATDLNNPRGLAFDGSGNLFVAESLGNFMGDILEFPVEGGSPTVFASGIPRPEFLTFGPPR
jgi:DNA-binding beta-propeller fold protein YncE